MNINYRGQTIDIRQPNPCDNCGHVAETVPFEGRELCDSCARPMTLERIKTGLSFEEVAAIKVYRQFDLQEWFNDGHKLLNKLINTCPDCGGELEDGECYWCDHEECREHGKMCEDCLGTAIDDAMDRMEAYQ